MGGQPLRLAVGLPQWHAPQEMIGAVMRRPSLKGRGGLVPLAGLPARPAAVSISCHTAVHSLWRLAAGENELDQDIRRVA